MSTHNSRVLPRAWIGVDLDGTLAVYDGWRGFGHIGEPIPAMVDRVKQWLADGKDVRIFTARVFPENRPDGWEPSKVRDLIQDWCEEHIGRRLPVTYQKDFAMIEIWDDRAVQVIPNTGVAVEELRGVVKEFMDILDTTEETDEGRSFHPTTISSCRVLTGERLNHILQRMKELSCK